MVEMKTEVKHNHLQQRMNDIRDNPHLIQFYSSKKCKDCYGRGVRTMSVNTGDNWIEQPTLCPCVRKAVAKEAKELECTDG